MAAPAQSVHQFTGVEHRRSTRLQRAVRLMIVGLNQQGQPFREKMSTVSVNLHGCHYQSWHDSQLGMKVEMQVMEGVEAKSPVVIGRVRSIRPPMSHSELYQIGVEFDTPANIWGIATPPEDWLRVLEGTSTTTELAAAAAPASEPEETAAAPVPQTQGPAAPESQTPLPTESPAPPPAGATPAPATAAVPAKLERVTITMDQLIAALQGKLQRAAERAVQTALQTQLEETVKSSMQAAVTSQLDEAVRQALCKIDEISTANVRQAEAVSNQRLEELTRSSREDLLSQVDARLAEFHGRLENQQHASRNQADEIVQRLEKFAADAHHELAETRKVVESFALQPERQPEPQIQAALEGSIGRATELFEAAATRISDRQLVRLIEDKQMVARETTSHLEACGAESRALLQSAANSTLEEFRRQLEVQVDLALSESAQRASSSLATLEAENRAACEARRRALEEEVTRATGQATEQFRSGIKAFLYASLVAAVGAVDEHAQATLAGLVQDRGNNSPREIGKLPDSSATAENPGEPATS
jgi:hypothetical protein